MIWNDETNEIYRKEISEYPYPINSDEDEQAYNVSFALTILKIAKISGDKAEAKRQRAKLRRLGYYVSYTND